MSKRLTEEAERYIEDFISNVEDTDISSLDGERSDTSSSLGGMSKMLTFQSPVLSKSIPVEMDGIVLPWLQWETSNDASPLSSKTSESVATPTTNLWEATQVISLICCFPSVSSFCNMFYHIILLTCLLCKSMQTGPSVFYSSVHSFSTYIIGRNPYARFK